MEMTRSESAVSEFVFRPSASPGSSPEEGTIYTHTYVYMFSIDAEVCVGRLWCYCFWREHGMKYANSTSIYFYSSYFSPVQHTMQTRTSFGREACTRFNLLTKQRMTVRKW